MKSTIFGHFYDFQLQKVNKYYTFQVSIRACALLMSYYFGIKSIYYAGLANLNFGIVSCCYIFSIVINVTCGFLFFEEKLTGRKVLASLSSLQVSYGFLCQRDKDMINQTSLLSPMMLLNGINSSQYSLLYASGSSMRLRQCMESLWWNRRHMI